MADDMCHRVWLLYHEVRSSVCEFKDSGILATKKTAYPKARQQDPAASRYEALGSFCVRIICRQGMLPSRASRIVGGIGGGTLLLAMAFQMQFALMQQYVTVAVNRYNS
jgi:hypothetical protein